MKRIQGRDEGVIGVIEQGGFKTEVSFEDERFFEEGVKEESR